MRKKQIYALIGIILATILIVAGAWALKSGKFAGLADAGPAEINVYAKNSNGIGLNQVDIFLSNDNSHYTFIGKTDANGHFTYLDISSQNHISYFKASLPYHSSIPEYRQLYVIPGKIYNIDFTLTPVTSDPSKGKVDLQFIVRDRSLATSSLAGIRVEAKNTPGGPVLASLITTKQGAYFNQLNPGMTPNEGTVLNNRLKFTKFLPIPIGGREKSM